MARPHKAVPLSEDQLDVYKKRVAALVEQNQLGMAEEAAAGGRSYIKELKALARNARDERARFSALAKLVDIAMPKKDSPLVSIQVGQNFVSHLGLPPPIERTAIDVIPEFAQLPARPSLLPEPEVMPKEIVVEAELPRPKVGGEPTYRPRFERKKIDMNEDHFPREIEHIDPKSLPEASPKLLSAVPKQPEGHPVAEKYSESE